MSPTCLIGESDTFLARLLARFCEASGLSVVRAQVGEEVLALAATCNPDMMILDVELPGEQRGWEVVQYLNGQADTRAVPIIACSWLPRPEVIALVSECAAYLQKPDLHYDDFLAALKDVGFEPTPR